MVSRDELVQFIENTIGLDLLTHARKIDPSANGIQVRGSEEVSKLVLGVSCNLAFLEEAVSAHANMTLTHHGLNLSSKYLVGARLDLGAQKRLKFALDNSLTIAAYHHGLDAQPVFGNNATIIKELGGELTGDKYFEGWGYVGEFKSPQSAKLVASRCAKLFAHDIYAVYGGASKIKRFGVCSGGARLYGEALFEAKEKNLDLHISGEISEGLDHLARENEINYFAGGHYATEVFGVQELGKLIKAKYKDQLDVEFIDIPSPL